MVPSDPAAECDPTRLRMRPDPMHLGMCCCDVGPRVAGQRVLVRDHGPAILGREGCLVRRHHRTLALVGFGRAALTHPPEPVLRRHLSDHRGILQRGWFQLEARRRWAIAGTPRPVADSALRLINRPSTFENLLVGPEIYRR